MSARSWLYVPGDRPELLAGSVRRGADALVLDLEDAVPLANKEAAREHVRAHLDQAVGGPARWVRVDAGAIEHDITAVAAASPTGIVLAKADPERIRELDEALTTAEAVTDEPVGATPVVALVESATAVEQLEAIARGPRVRQLALGEADLAADLGVRPGPEDTELDPVRMRVVVASAAAGLLPPVGPVSTDFRDLAALRRSTDRFLRMGFEARQAIHPAQVPVINDALTPSDDEVRRARALVGAFERAQQADTGVLLDDEGRMVDLAVVRSARRTLERAEAAAGRAG